VAANAAALSLIFDLGTEPTYSTSAGSWQAGNFTAATGASHIVATLNATFYVTGVALMVGSGAVNAEPEFKKYSDNLIDCQRYYVKPGINLPAAANATGASQNFPTIWTAPQVMRSAPTVLAAWSGFVNATSGGISIQPDNRTLIANLTSSAAGILIGTLAITSLDADF
jgi:hypothetical protein